MCEPISFQGLGESEASESILFELAK